MKAKLRSLLFSDGVALCEHINADLAGIRTLEGSQKILAVEFERSARNVINNLTRDFSLGADSVLIVCQNWNVASQICSRVSRQLPKTFHERTGIVTLVTLGILFPDRISEFKHSEEGKAQHENTATNGDQSPTTNHGRKE